MTININENICGLDIRTRSDFPSYLEMEMDDSYEIFAEEEVRKVVEVLTKWLEAQADRNERDGLSC